MMRARFDESTGDVILMVAGKEARLREPTLREFAELRERVAAADAEIGDLPRDATAEQVRERQDAIYRPDGPYALIVSDLLAANGWDVSAEDLPAWCASPMLLAWLLSQWSAPLAGQDRVSR